MGCRSLAQRFQAIIMLTVSVALAVAGAMSLLLCASDWNRSKAVTAATFLLAPLVAFAIAFAVGLRLQQCLSQPIILLAQAAKRAALFHDCSIRVAKSSDDEIGLLVDGFNEMLAALEKHQNELAAQRAELEEDVCVRTAELRSVSAELDHARHRAQAAIRAQSRILRTTCHQIRTPMNAILGMTDLALGTRLSPEQRSYLLTAKQSAQSLLAILNDILGGSDFDFREGEYAASAPAGAPQSGLYILVVEDHADSQKLVRTMLHKCGYRTRLVSNGREAIEALAGESFDAILMDLEMPVMGGMEATRVIRRTECDGRRHIPIVAMTAHAMRGDRERCLACGMDAYVSKPLRPDLLRQAIEQACTACAVAR